MLQSQPFYNSNTFKTRYCQATDFTVTPLVKQIALMGLLFTSFATQIYKILIIYFRLA